MSESLSLLCSTGQITVRNSSGGIVHCRKPPKQGSRYREARGRVGTEFVPLDMFSQTLFQGVVHIQCSESVQG